MGDTYTMEIVKALYYIIDCVNFFDRVSKLPCCNTCGKLKDCEYRPEWGDQTRINCPLWEKEENG